MLGAAGLLKGLPATTHWSAYDELASYGAKPTELRVVTSGRIVTGAGVSAGIDLALNLATDIAGPEIAQTIQLAIEYDPIRHSRPARRPRRRRQSTTWPLRPSAIERLTTLDASPDDSYWQRAFMSRSGWRMPARSD
jgi:transcriptional regulator GlxA family with amidase domain